MIFFTPIEPLKFIGTYLILCNTMVNFTLAIMNNVNCNHAGIEAFPANTTKAENTMFQEIFKKYNNVVVSTKYIQCSINRMSYDEYGFHFYFNIYSIINGSKTTAAATDHTHENVLFDDMISINELPEVTIPISNATVDKINLERKINTLRNLTRHFYNKLSQNQKEETSSIFETQFNFPTGFVDTLINHNDHNININDTLKPGCLKDLCAIISLIILMIHYSFDAYYSLSPLQLSISLMLTIIKMIIKILLS